VESFIKGNVKKKLRNSITLQIPAYEGLSKMKQDIKKAGYSLCLHKLTADR